MAAIIRRSCFLTSLLACALSIGCGGSGAEGETAKKVESVADETGGQEPEGQGGSKTESKSKNDASDGGQAKKDDAKNGQAKMGGMAGMSGMSGMGKMKFPDPADMKFKDEVDSNVKVQKKMSELVFTNKDGSQIKLSDFLGKKNVILVFTEGFNGMLCPFCKTQTSRLVSNYDKFKARNCEIIVVYPGPKDHLDEFVEAALKTEKKQVDQVPFPIVLDEDFAATDYFDIHSMHAHPSTYLIDKNGGVQFAYVGNDMTADRPSIKAMLNRLDQLPK